jgi:hypothetical protein
MPATRSNFWSDIFLAPEHIELAEMARKFAQKEITPKAAEIDSQHRFPSEIISQMAEMGFMGIMVAPEWGGAGLDALSYTTVLEEISVACASTSVIMSVNNSLVCHPIEKYGSKEIKEEFMTDVISYEFLNYRDVHRQLANGQKTHWLALDFIVEIDPSQAQIGEPHKFEALGWFRLGNLPTPAHSTQEYLLRTFKDKLVKFY